MKIPESSFPGNYSRRPEESQKEPSDFKVVKKETKVQKNGSTFHVIALRNLVIAYLYHFINNYFAFINFVFHNDTEKYFSLII